MANGKERRYLDIHSGQEYLAQAHFQFVLIRAWRNHALGVIRHQLSWFQ